MILAAEISFSLTGAEEPLVKQLVKGDATFEMFGDLSSAKREALPDAAKDLAHKIVESVVEYW